MNQQSDERYPCDDPIVDEIRAIREEISDTFDNDVHRLCNHLRETERAYADRILDPAKRNLEREPTREKPKHHRPQ